MSAFSRTKGASAEREVVHILRDAGWSNARRTHDGREQALLLRILILARFLRVGFALLDYPERELQLGVRPEPHFVHCVMSSQVVCLMIFRARLAPRCVVTTRYRGLTRTSFPALTT